MILINLVNVNHQIYYVQGKTPKIKRLNQCIVANTWELGVENWFFNTQDGKYQTNRCETGVNKQDCVSRLLEHELL